MCCFCAALFEFLPFDLPPSTPVVVQTLLFALYTGERHCWSFVELVDVIGTHIVPLIAVVVDEPLLSDR